ncbi:hypothetical protein B0H13DRAFT_2392046 [Mycena leptocephala]|nr:hypothetical protein B0H13DRAFT_2392046 [Mycena leptocephala]
MLLTPLQNLAAPPEDFSPCTIPLHLGVNFTNHVEFSGKGNKRYWVLHLGHGQGVYTLKVECVAAAGRYAKVPEAYEPLDRWQLVVSHWAKHCFHRHGKCASHRNACTDGQCPTHPAAEYPGEVRVPRRMKVELDGKGSIKTERDVSVKVECDAKVKLERGVLPLAAARSAARPRPESLSRATSTSICLPPSREATPLVGPPSKRNLALRARRAAQKEEQTGRPPPPRYTPIEETESEGEGGHRQPLFDPDSSEEERSAPPLRTSTLRPTTAAEQERPAPAPVSATPPSPTPSSRPMRMRRIEDIAASYKPHPRAIAVPPPSSAGVSSVSSLSMSSLSTSPATSPAISTSTWAKQRGVAGTAAGAGDEKGASVSMRDVEDPGAHLDDPFFVASSGVIHHSSSRAFEDVSSGPVWVVMGWEEATRVALEVVSSVKGPVDRKGKGKAKEGSTTRSMRMDVD